MNVRDLRQDYRAGELRRRDMAAEPMMQFARWFEEATGDARILEPNAMVLSTADPDGTVMSRTVLMKGFDARGVQFFTNYESRKGQQIAKNTRVALAFFWPGLERQVLIAGVAVRMERDESEGYFRSRPRGSRIGAWASLQSREVASREELEAAYRAADARFPGEDVPMPPCWGGYRVEPTTVEFWQGRSGRLHDRFVYEPAPEGWTLKRLQP